MFGDSSDKFQIEWQTLEWRTTNYMALAEAALPAYRRAAFLPIKFHCAKIFYEIMFMGIITSVPVLFIICYLIYRSMVTL